MNPQDAIDFSREALKTCMMVGGPILAASLVIGLLVGVFQAMTQVQDQTVSFVPKILLLIVMIGLCLPWLTDKMLSFAKLSFEKPMTQWSNSHPGPLFPDPKAKPSSGQFQSAFANPSSNQTMIQPVAATTTKFIQAGNRDEFELPITEVPHTFEVAPEIPTKSPFILPHYRISKAPKQEIGG